MGRRKEEERVSKWDANFLHFQPAVFVIFFHFCTTITPLKIGAAHEGWATPQGRNAEKSCNTQTMCLQTATCEMERQRRKTTAITKQKKQFAGMGSLLEASCCCCRHDRKHGILETVGTSNMQPHNNNNKLESYNKNNNKTH